MNNVFTENMRATYSKDLFQVLGTEKDSNSDSIEATIQEEINSENAEERFSTCKIVK